MSDLDLTEALAAGRRGLAERLTWPSMHWGVEDVHPDAWPHVVAAAVAAAAPLIAAQVRAQVAAEIDGDVSLFADIERLAAGDNPSTAADAIQDAVVARIARGEF